MIIGQRCILIYNPVSGHGHLDSWNAIFVSLMLDNGWHVLALTPDPVALTSRLAQKGLTESKRLQVLDWDARNNSISLDSLSTLLHRAWKNWNIVGDRYLYKRPGSETTADMPAMRYWNKRFLQSVVPFLFRASYFIYKNYYLRHKSVEAAASGTEANFFSPTTFAKRMNTAIRKAKWKPVIAFNMYMDMYKTDNDSWGAFSSLNTIPWAGIRFVPPDAPYESYYSQPSLKGMCFLDGRISSAYRDQLPDKIFECLPDITETALPNEPSPISEIIKQKAAGRKIVFLGGSIGGQKNLAKWLELIAITDPDKWFFVQIGELHEGTFTIEDSNSWKQTVASPPENLYIKTEYIASEEVFNEIISITDVIFAVYRDFRISSNMLGKAANFKKPILVSDQYLMGTRVRQYGIGLAVPEDDVEKIHDGLLYVQSNTIPDERFLQFCSDFSMENLGKRLNHFLDNCLRQDSGNLH